MEIALGILLIFGAFTLGAVTSDRTDHESQATQMESEGAVHQVQAVAAGSRERCQASEAVRHYRDLTVPIAKPPAQPPTQASTDEDDGWDE